MPTLRCEVMLTLDGQPVSGFPYVRTLSASSVQPYEFAYTVSASNIALPNPYIVTESALVVQPAGNVAIRMQGVGSDIVTLNGGGLLLMLDVVQDLTGGKNETVRNLTAAPNLVKGLVLGT